MKLTDDDLTDLLASVLYRFDRFEMKLESSYQHKRINLGKPTVFGRRKHTKRLGFIMFLVNEGDLILSIMI